MSVARAREAVGTVITIFGARGGIGKSTIATNLAVGLARGTDRSVLVIDMDTGFGNVALMMSIQPTSTIVDLAGLDEPLDAATFRRALVAHESGAFVLPAPGDPSAWGAVTAAQVQGVVRFAAHQFDYVILDTAGIFNDIVATAVGIADRVMVINSLDMASTRQTAQMFDLLDAERFPPAHLRLVLNQITRTLMILPNDVRAIVRQPIYWTIPYDANVPNSHSLGQPLVLTHRGSQAALQLLGLARKLAEENGDWRPSWVRRVLSKLTPRRGGARRAARTPHAAPRPQDRILP